MSNFKDFTHLYPLSKTLRFELKPIGETKENFSNSGLLKREEQKSTDYPKVKHLIDECHKFLINDALKVDKVKNLDWSSLQSAIKEYQKEKSDKNKKALENAQEKMRSKIFDILSKSKYYEELIASTPKKLLNDTELLKKVIGEAYAENTELKTFNGFATYFKGFQENRKNIYSSNAISTAVPFRSVHENFPKFLANIEIYNNINETCAEVLDDAKKELQPFLDSMSLSDIFSIDFYNRLLSQNGIDYFNQILGGVTQSEGKIKLRGINEFVNLYLQKHPDVKVKKKALTMSPLFKQILSDRETLSFIPQTISSDQELVSIIKQFHENIISAEINGEKVNILECLCSLLCSIKEYDKERIYINSNYLTDISYSICNSWSYIGECLKVKATAKYGTATKTAIQKIDSYTKQTAYSLEELSCVNADLLPYFNKCSNMPQDIEGKYNCFCLNVDSDKNTNLREDDIRIEFVKDLLDTYMNLLHISKAFVVPENLDLDRSFYANFFVYYEYLRAIIPLHTKVRNYLTQKVYDDSKIKLTFDTPTLAAGWDKNKEKDNACIILRRNGLYYLGIIAKEHKKLLLQAMPSEGNCYEKMNYKQFDITKQLPKCTTETKKVKAAIEAGEESVTLDDAKKWNKPLVITTELWQLNNYVWDKNTMKWERRKKDNENRPKKFQKKYLEDTGDIDGYNKAKATWIDFAKTFLSSYKSTEIFNIKYEDSYDSVNKFYTQLDNELYNVSFTNVSASYIDELVKDGKMYLFQIYNKDYAKGSHGTKNLHTMYWEHLFSKENLANYVLKLNGEAELFYRKGSIKKPFSHKVGEKMLNKRDKSGMPIPDDIYKELYNYYNGKICKDKLSDNAMSKMNDVVVKEVSHEIIKDRRYTLPHFQFHVPITINFCAHDDSNINNQVLDYIKDKPNINIIGLDRGERNLIYLTLINQKGEILKQKTFNIVNKMNYQIKLSQREKERDNARKSWKSIGKIKELKEGFLSAVIHEITSMMVEYNAIVVMEELNYGFKRGRFKVERQVYQKFEKMLIDKLNYLSFKNVTVNENGGILQGYQLSNKFESFKKLGKQSGFLFYIPAAYTSKIDPVSGFVNLFNFNDLTNTKAKKEFFSKFDDIKFISHEEGFKFTFDYSNFRTYQTDFTKRWTISTQGRRIIIREKDGHKQMVDYYPTKDIFDSLTNAGFIITPEMDIKAIIDTVEANKSSTHFFNTLLFAFKATLQMRNSNSETDFIISPICVDGKYYNSDIEAKKGKDEGGNWKSKLPVDADANGAYHIALKGLYTLIHHTEKIEHTNWFEFIQTKPYKK